MKHLLLLFFSLTLISPAIKSQILRGKITDKAGEPIPYSSIYIQDLKLGTAANTKGNYEIRLPEGKYTVIYQSLGFAPDIRIVNLGKNTITIDIVLQVQYYEIPEVRITASGEDPAYGIMRKVIGLAPYHLNQVNYYKADVYLKGDLAINRIPKLLQKSMKVEVSNNNTSLTAGGVHQKEERIIKEGEAFLMESVNELEFNAPDKYIQKVISYNSTFPEQGNEISPMDFIQASFYQSLIGSIAISPLSPEAFSHYNFKYLGVSSQGNFTIDKIKVVPKRKSQQLFAGTIYIVEDLWCLHSVDLINENLAGKVRIQQLYIPVQDDIWMPVSHKFEINISILGFKADAGYGSSVKYLDVKPNTSLQKPQMTGTDYIGNATRPGGSADTVKTKTKQQIEKILSKEELTNRDMVRLSNLIEKESKESINDSIKNNLEIKDNITHIVEKDANKKDSLYWAEIRPIPLSDVEIRSLRTADSLKSKPGIKKPVIDSSEIKNNKNKKFWRTVKDIGSGHTWSDTTGFSFVNGGLIKLKNLSFNPVDGFIYGFNFRLIKSWKNVKSLSFYPDLKWAFSRERIMWRLNGQYKFDMLKQKQIYFRSGMTSKDINNNGGINTLLNTVTSLALKRNYMKLYESTFLTLGYKMEIINGLYGDISSSYEDRKILSNTTDFSLFRSSRDYTENVPDNKFLKNPIGPVNPLRDLKHANITASVTYTPRQKYRLNKNVKIPRGSDWPTFVVTWKHGINEYTELTPSLRHYDMIKFEASKRREIGAFSEYRWLVRTGGFLNNSSVSFYDFFHFNSQPLPVLITNYENAFMLPGFYSLSTPEFFTEGHLEYTSPYLLIKLLPVLSNTLMRENLSLSYLWSRYQKSYTEIGYSVSEIFFLGEAGIYAGFDNLKFNSFGVKVILKFN